MLYILLLLLKPALRFVDGREWRYLPFALVAWVLDVILAHTTFSLIAGRPLSKEWTISQMLERLAHPFNSLDENYHFYRQLALFINRASPTGNHIKAVQ